MKSLALEMRKLNVLIIGAGPGGSAAAMFLIREGIRPLILEQEEFPRFHIGESLTGESAQVLRRDPIFSFGVTVTMREAKFVVPRGATTRRVMGVLKKSLREHEIACGKDTDKLQDTVDLF